MVKQEPPPPTQQPTAVLIKSPPRNLVITPTHGSQSSSIQQVTVQSPHSPQSLSATPHQIQILQITPQNTATEGANYQQQQQMRQQLQLQNRNLTPSVDGIVHNDRRQQIETRIQRADQVRATSNSVTVVVIKTMLPEHK